MGSEFLDKIQYNFCMVFHTLTYTVYSVEGIESRVAKKSTYTSYFHEIGGLLGFDRVIFSTGLILSRLVVSLPFIAFLSTSSFHQEADSL
ncbi:hypothetical protein GW750_07640 [bacterium]|nr:hypothetical protein [bacterium]